MNAIQSIECLNQSNMIDSLLAQDLKRKTILLPDNQSELWKLVTGAQSEKDIPIPIDPLDGIPSLLDLRTHKGDKIPFGINPTVDESNLEWIGLVGSSSQAIETRQPLTKFTIDNTPFLDFDGLDDWMSIGSMPGPITYSCLIRSKASAWNSFWSFMDSVVPGSARLGSIGESGQTYLHSNPYPVSVRRNGLDLASPFDCDPIDEWAVYTVVTQSRPSSEVGIFQLDGTQFGGAQAIAFFIHDGIPSLEQIQQVESYYETLKPA